MCISCAYHVQVIENLPCSSAQMGYMLIFSQDIMCMLDIDALMLLSFGLP